MAVQSKDFESYETLFTISSGIANYYAKGDTIANGVVVMSASGWKGSGASAVQGDAGRATPYWAARSPYTVTFFADSSADAGTLLALPGGAQSARNLTVELESLMTQQSDGKILYKSSEYKQFTGCNVVDVSASAMTEGMASGYIVGTDNLMSYQLITLTFTVTMLATFTINKVAQPIAGFHL